MSQIRIFRYLVIFVLALTANYAQAANLWWDGGTVDIGTDGNGISGGTAGNWNTALLNWDVGASLHIAWVNANNDTAVFGGTAGTVTLTAPVAVGGITFFSNSGYTITSGALGLTFGAPNNTIRLINVSGTTTAATISGTVTGIGNLVLTSAAADVASTLTLSGTSAGGWSGTTTINPSMTLSISGLNQGLLNTTGGITLNGGSITLTSADSDAEKALDRVKDDAAITSNGGTITYTTTTAASTKVFAETVGLVALTTGQLNIFEALNKTAGTQTLTLSDLTQANKAAITFSSPSLNATINMIKVSNINGSPTSATAADQIFAAWATVGTTANLQTDYAIFDASSNVLARGTTGSLESTWTAAASAYVNDLAAQTLGSTRTVNALRNTGATATLTLASGANLETYGLLNGVTTLLTVAPGTGGVLTTPTGGGNLYLNAGSGAITVSAPINNNGGNVTLVKNGTGTLTLSSTASDYSGGTVLNAGTLAIGNVANIGGAGASLTFGGTATFAPSAALNFSTGTLNVNAGAYGTITGNGTTAFQTTTGSGTLRYTSGANTGILNLGNADGFTGNLQFRLTGNAGYAGATTIQFSSLGDGVGSALQVGGGQTDSSAPVGQKVNIVLSGGSASLVFDNRRIELLTRIASNHTVGDTALHNNNASSANTWVINTDLSYQVDQARYFELAGSNAGDNEFAGVISDGNVGGTITLRKDGAGKWILSGNNTYSGSTTIIAGTLIVSGTNTCSGATTLSAGKLVGVTGGSCSNSAVTVSAGTLGVSVTDTNKQWTCGSLTHTAAATLEFAFDANTPSTNLAPLQVNGDIVFAVAPTVSCTGSSLPAGTYPLMKWAGTFSGVAPSSLTLPSGTGILVFDGANKTLWLSISASGASKQPLTWKGPAGNTWVANEAIYTKWQDATTPTPVSTNYQETTVGGITVGDNVVFGTTGAGTVTLNTNVYPASVQVNTTGSYTISGSGSIGGVGSLTKSSTSTLTLSTTNSYSGGTLLSAGTIIIATNNALGTGSLVLGAGTIQSSDATARTLNNPVVLNGSSIVGGTGNLTFSNPGAGSLAVNSQITVSSSGVNATIASALSGAFTLTKAGAGTLTLTGANTFTGATTINAGKIVLNNDGDVTGSAILFNASNTSLTITGGSGVTSTWNAGGGDITTVSGPVDNVQMLIDGAGTAGSAVVTNVNNLVWGRTSQNSMLTLTNGGRMQVNGEIRVGNTYYGPTGNSDIIIGSGTAISTLTGNNGALYIGHSTGAGERNGCKDNDVTVNSNGVLTGIGSVYVGMVGYSANGNSTNNKLTINGTGTASMAGVTVGHASVGVDAANANVVQVTNGGQLTSSGANYIGRATVAGANANANTATVTGTGSSWNAGNQTVYVGYSVSGAVSTGNVLTVSNGGVVTNVSALIVKATNTLSLGVGGQIYAGVVTNAGIMNVVLDDSMNAGSWGLNVTGRLDITGCTLNITGEGLGVFNFANYGTLIGSSFAVTNGLPNGARVEYTYGSANQIAIVAPPGGTVIMFR